MPRPGFPVLHLGGLHCAALACQFGMPVALVLFQGGCAIVMLMHSVHFDTSFQAFHEECYGTLELLVCFLRSMARWPCAC